MPQQGPTLGLLASTPQHAQPLWAQGSVPTWHLIGGSWIPTPLPSVLPPAGGVCSVAGTRAPVHLPISTSYFGEQLQAGAATLAAKPTRVGLEASCARVPGWQVPPHVPGPRGPSVPRRLCGLPCCREQTAEDVRPRSCPSGVSTWGWRPSQEEEVDPDSSHTRRVPVPSRPRPRPQLLPGWAVPGARSAW